MEGAYSPSCAGILIERAAELKERRLSAAGKLGAARCSKGRRSTSVCLDDALPDLSVHEKESPERGEAITRKEYRMETCRPGVFSCCTCTIIR